MFGENGNRVLPGTLRQDTGVCEASCGQRSLAWRASLAAGVSGGPGQRRGWWVPPVSEAGAARVSWWSGRDAGKSPVAHREPSRPLATDGEGGGERGSRATWGAHRVAF